MEKSDLRKYDIFCQYAMAAATQAVEESGVKGTLPPERIGTYFGSGIGGMHTFAEEQKTLMEKGPRRVSPFFVPGMIINMAGGLIAIKYNFQGASIPIVTACATATTPSARPTGPSSTAIWTRCSPAAPRRPSSPLAWRALAT